MPSENVTELNDQSSKKSSKDNAENVPNEKEVEAEVVTSSQCDKTLAINENMTLKG